jgi:putative copper resistance protein D
MPGIAGFLDSLLRGSMLVALAVALGGVAWRLVVLRDAAPPAPTVAVRRCLLIVAVGAMGLAGAQIAALALKAGELSRVLGPDAFREFAATAQFAAASTRAALAVGLAACAVWIRRSPAGSSQRLVLAVLALAIAASGAWLTHAAGRLDHRALLMSATVVHQVAAATWIGGLVQVAAFWRLSRRRADVDALWPVVVARFSRVALVSLVVVVLSAGPLVLTLVGTWDGLVGTGYGSLVATKSLLLVAVLLLGALNFSDARAVGGDDVKRLRARLPYLVEAEILFAVAILFTATSLSSQPPAVDLTEDRATWSEVVEVFRPKVPDLRTPSVATMRADRALDTEDGAAPRSREAYEWSNFSHNVAGLILLGVSALALLGVALGGAWGTRWPLGFLLLAVFIGLRAAANEGTWPFGTMSLFELRVEGLQHRIAGVLVVALGVFEWRARARARRRGPLPFVFPALAVLGAILLLTHSHTAFESKAGFLVQVTHTTIGALAAVIAAGRWLELRLAPPAAAVAGAASAVAMLLIALVLVFYREANVVVTADVPAPPAAPRSIPSTP